MDQKRSTQVGLLVASLLAFVAGCAGWTPAPRPLAANTPVPELDVQLGESAASPSATAERVAARPTVGSPILRGQTPNYWSDYQSSGNQSSSTMPYSDGTPRRPMQPSGSPVPYGTATQPAPNANYGYTPTPQSRPGYTLPNYGGRNAAPAPTSTPGYTIPTYNPPASNGPQYNPFPNGATNNSGGYPAAAYGMQPPGSYTSAPPAFGESVQPGNMISGATFPPDVIPPSVADGMQPLPEVPIDVILQETRTGRFMFGVGVNSDAGVTGQIVLDERNFDLFNPPTSWDEVANGTAWRGGGQGFRIEAIPGNQVQRYLVSYTDPYMFGFLPYSLNLSGFLYDRIFRDWDEERFGGRVAIGNRLTPDLSMSVGLRGEQVNISRPRVAGVPQLDAVIGESDLFGGSVTLTRDTRDVPFSPTQGSLIELTYEQMFGDFDYPRGSIDLRQYFLVRERPDTSGRHTLAFIFKVGMSGSQTPIFENYFAGGFSTMRGFSFRGASPVNGGVVVGGRFQFLGTVEYMFPLTADDMIKGVVFTDFGTVEEDIEINPENYRVAPGVGLRVAIPALGPAPLAFDFAFPVAHAATDDRQIFSFFFGFGR